ncbi:MAG: HlyC/CorC family transporter [Firmicutes bacterium]|nr:HlyC/CorC family transporter [Bacillota bacterium]
MSDIDFYYRVVILFILLILSGVFSSSETAMTAINIARIKQLKEKDEKAANVLERLKKELNTILATILIGNNLVNIAATAILTELTVEMFGQSGTLVATGIMTTLILIFGEITPKTYAAQNPEKLATKVGRPLEMLSIVFKPILILLNGITNFILKIFGGEDSKNSPFVTEEDIRSWVDVGEEEGVVKHQAKEMIEGVFEIDDIDVTEVMIPRIDVNAISKDKSLKDALDLIITYGHSRIPIYSDTIDDIVGILYAKDILPFVNADNSVIKGKTISSLMRPAYYVPETKKVNKLLRELQQQKIHMAIVLDEYGGTEGLVTIEDILEEIVGDILDEYDNEIDLYEKVDDNVYLVKAEISLEDFNDLFTTELPENEFDSLGGFIFSNLGRVPVKEDFIEYNYMVITVKEVSNRRIKKVEIKFKGKNK